MALFNTHYPYMGGAGDAGNPILAFNAAHGGDSQFTPYEKKQTYNNATFIAMCTRVYSAQSGTAATYTIMSGNNSFELSRTASEQAVSRKIQPMKYEKELELLGTASQTSNNVASAFAVKTMPTMYVTNVRSNFKYGGNYLVGRFGFDENTYNNGSVTLTPGTYNVWTLAIGGSSNPDEDFAYFGKRTAPNKTILFNDMLNNPVLTKITVTENTDFGVFIKSVGTDIESAILGLVYKI